MSEPSLHVGAAVLERYEQSLLRVFGRPSRVLSHGDGCYVVDVDGHRYLDLLSGLAVNALGHNHPDLVRAIGEQAAKAIHVSNFFTTSAQVGLAERILALSGAPAGSAVFFTNSGTEAIEAAVKLARRTGRTGMIAAEGAFHGRTTGALALTHKTAYREPFGPLMPGVVHVPFNDEVALKQVFTDASAQGPDAIGAVFLEPVQGEAGVIPADPSYLRLARELTSAHDALLIIDEIQTGIGRTGTWLAFQQAGIMPDAFTLAKGLGGGVPIGALVTVGADVSALLSAGQHGSTFGGNPLACAAGLAVLDVIERDDLLRNVVTVGDSIADEVAALGHPAIPGTRGAGLLRAIALRDPVAPAVTAQALDAGFIVNAPNPSTIRLAPPLILTIDQARSFVHALPSLLEATAVPAHPPTAVPAHPPTAVPAHPATSEAHR